MTQMTRAQFQCQEDSPLALDLLHPSTPLVRGVFPLRRHFVLVLLVGEPCVEGPVDIEEVEGDVFVFRAGIRIVFQPHDNL